MSLVHQYSGFLHSNLLWNSEALFELPQFNLEKLYKNINAQEVTNNIHINQNEVLGKRIEHFFEYCINSSNYYEIIAKNLQVFQEKITIGELDFLIKDLQKEEILHVELIYKFYIYDPDINQEINKWIGPNRKDSLLQKVEKLKSKQLPLLFKNETKSILERLNLKSAHIKQQVCYMANLFVPYSLINTTFAHINNDCIIGYWVKFQDFSSKKYAPNLFHIPKKQDWVVDPTHCDSWFSFDDIYEQIYLLYQQKKSPLLWMNNGDNSYDRFFVVWW